VIRGNLIGLAAVAGAAGLATQTGFGGPSGGCHKEAPGASAPVTGPADLTTPGDPPAETNSAATNGTPTAPPSAGAIGGAAADSAAPACDQNTFAAVGVPQIVGSDHEERVICRPGYTVSFDSRTRDPDWVIEHVPAAQLSGTAMRGNRFMADPLLGAAGSQLADYARSGYDRGHQAPAGDFKSSQAMMDESFYLSNMAPQVGIGFNRGEWAYVEGTVRCWLRAGVVSNVYIVTGPIYGDHPATIGPDHIVVPKSFFKIVYDPDQQRAIGFELPNVKTQRQSVANFITPIAQIEQDTGLEFLPAVSANLFKDDKPVMWANEDQCAGGDSGG
jgi:endonuclease G